MKSYLQKTYIYIKTACFLDRLNLIFLCSLFVVLLLDYLIWRIKLTDRDVFIFTLNGVYPIKYLFLICLINVFLAIFSFNKEKEIGYLLYSASFFMAALVLILEFFYIIGISYV